MTGLVENLLTACRAQGQTIATAESCTAGMLAAALTDPAGASAVFERGFVTYSNAAKREMLGVSTDSLQRFGAVSEQVAREMASGALNRSGTDLSVAITGIAGPGGSDHKPEGRVCFATACKGQDLRSETVEFGPLGRAQVRQAATEHALKLLWQRIATSG